jgi:hypothetical protein
MTYAEDGIIFGEVELMVTHLNKLLSILLKFVLIDIVQVRHHFQTFCKEISKLARIYNEVL